MAQAKKKKRFFEVEMPIIGKTTQLQAFEKKELDNKFIKYDLTRMLKGKSVIIDLKTKLEEDKITTYPLGIKVMQNSIKNFVRKGTDYVEDSFVVNCLNAELTIKPILITRRKVSKSVRKALRDKAKEEIINYMKDKNSEEIIEDALKNKIQKPLSLILKKIYPLSLCEIRLLKVNKFLEVQEKPKETKKKKEE